MSAILAYMHGGHLSAIPSILMLLLFAFLLLWRGGTRQRQTAMQAMADRLGLRSRPGNSLPRDLDLSATRFKRWTRLSHMYEGVLNGLPVMVGDVDVNRGKAAWARTLVMVRTPADPCREGATGLEVKRCGPWLVYYKPLGFWLGSGTYTKPAELELLLKAVSHNPGNARGAEDARGGTTA